MGVERGERREILGKGKNQLWEETKIVRDFHEKEMALEKGKGKETEKGVSWWETETEMERKNDLGA